MIFKFIKPDEPIVPMSTDIDEISEQLTQADIHSRDFEAVSATLDLHQDCVSIKDSSIAPFQIYKAAFDQWLQKVKIPLAYAYDIPFDMLLYNIERRSKQYKKTFLLRTVKHDSDIVKVGSEYDTIRAVLSKQYNVIRNSECFSQFKEVLRWSGMSVAKAIHGTNILQVIAHGNAKVDEYVSTGLELLNGETGYRSLELNTVIRFPNTYAIIADTKNTTKFNMKVIHLNKDIKKMMDGHAKMIIDNLDTFKRYIDVAERSEIKTSELMGLKDKMDVVLGRKETRSAIEGLNGKNKLQASEILASLGDELSDVEKQRVLKIAAGSLIMS